MNTARAALTALALTAPIAGHAQTFQQLYAFGGGADGAYPSASLTVYQNVLYGTTSGGNGSGSAGTVFSFDPTSNAYQVLHTFNGSPDGDAPLAELVWVAGEGAFYGTTFNGGNGTGTVFSITPGGVEKVVYSFAGGNDGAHPAAGLYYDSGNNTLYGTTTGGGTHGAGTVFTYNLTTSTERVLYDFGNNSADGSYPEGTLVYHSRLLYGTTSSNGYYGGGTVFSVSPTSGAETNLHYFYAQPGSTDGIGPEAGLVVVGTKLYGTTSIGGAACTVNSGGCGAVFDVTLSRAHTEKVKGFTGADGLYPRAPLIDVSGTLYGTTEQGGDAGTACGPVGCGTVFSFNPTTSAITVLHAFSGTSDDASSPMAGLVNVNGTLYGTTLGGGSGGAGVCVGTGCGTIFKLTP